MSKGVMSKLGGSTRVIPLQVAERYKNNTTSLQGQPQKRGRTWHDATMDPNERLTRARLAKGIRYASRAAKALGIPPSTYNAHENGTRNFDEKAETYAKFFGVDAEWLLTGRGRGPEEQRIDEKLIAGASSNDVDLWRQAWALAKDAEANHIKAKLGMHDLMRLAGDFFDELKQNSK
ncbi:helix-turn-helix transcriptional regulator [Breoghania sp. JC706]|uniref:helix-turn-helix domain-containing protein n=1 Tax=Breoghania sp. JC706 TaxID=3117732 RepID=UPI003009B321